MMSKFNSTRLILGFCSIALGNLAWFTFYRSLISDHLLTTSYIQITVSLLYSILAFGSYLSVTLYFSLFERKRVIWALVVLASVISYSWFASINTFSIIGTLIIASAIFYFLINFHRYKVLSKDRFSFIGQLYIGLAGVTLIISTVTAINFYTVYKNTLSGNEIVIPDKLNLDSIVKVYADDIGATDLNEPLSRFFKEKSKEQVLTKLSLTKASDTETVRELIRDSLRNSALSFISQYRSKLPIFLALGLGIITQTLITLSTLVCALITFILLQIFIKLKLIKKINKQIESEIIEAAEG